MGIVWNAGSVADTADPTRMCVLVHTGTAYPPRPAGLAGGQVRYIGPVQPTDWLDNDEWVNNS